MVHKRNGLKSNQCFESGSAGIRHESGTLIRRAKMARKKKKKQLNFLRAVTLPRLNSWTSVWLKTWVFCSILLTVPSIGGLLRKLPNTFTCLLEYTHFLGISCLPPSHLAKCGKLARTANILPLPPPPQSQKAKREFSFFCSNKPKNRCTTYIPYVVHPKSNWKK